MATGTRVSVRLTVDKGGMVKHDADAWSIDSDGNLHISRYGAADGPPVGEILKELMIPEVGTRPEKGALNHTVVAVYARGAWASVALVEQAPGT